MYVLDLRASNIIWMSILNSCGLILITVNKMVVTISLSSRATNQMFQCIFIFTVVIKDTLSCDYSDHFGSGQVIQKL